MTTETEEPPTTSEIIRIVMQSERDRLKRETEMLETCERIMERMPEVAIKGCAIVCDTLIIYNLNREQTTETILALGAGKWTKSVNSSDPTRLNYDAKVEGIPVQIWNTPPPASCRIVEEQVYVPAGNITKRTLVCH